MTARPTGGHDLLDLLAERPEQALRDHPDFREVVRHWNLVSSVQARSAGILRGVLIGAPIFPVMAALQAGREMEIGSRAFLVTIGLALSITLLGCVVPIGWIGLRLSMTRIGLHGAVREAVPASGGLPPDRLALALINASVGLQPEAEDRIRLADLAWLNR